MASVMRVDQFLQQGGRPNGSPDRSPSKESGLETVRAERLGEFRRMVEGEQSRSLSRLIESEIIPRLLVAHTAPSYALPDTLTDGCVSPEEVAAFAPLTLQVEADELLEHVERLVARGVPLETLLVDLLAPTARALGEFWEEDRCDFVDVTMGLWRLQEVVHELSGRAACHQRPLSEQRRALFASLEGDQHSFGTVVIEELFGANGWLTDRLNEAATDELVGRVQEEWFDLAGLTITCDCHIAPLPSILREIRAASRNPKICVMVGGRMFANDSTLAASIGADGTAPDARAAVRIAGELVDAVAQEAVCR